MSILVIWILFGVLGAVVAANKGRSGFGWFLLGVLLGPLGLLLSLVVPKNQLVIKQEAIDFGGMKKCPYRAESIKAEAIKCRYCGADVPQRVDPLPSESSTVTDKPAAIQCPWCNAQVYATAETCDVCFKSLKTSTGLAA